MITKVIDFQEFNKAEVIKVYENGSVLTNLIYEEVTEDTETKELTTVELHRECNISFDVDKLPFELTKEDLDILNPPVVEPLIEE